MCRSKQRQETNNVTQYSLPPWAEAAAQQNVNLAGDLTSNLIPDAENMPATRVADFTPDQLAMFEGVRNLPGSDITAADLGQSYYRGFADRGPYTMAQMGGIAQVGDVTPMQAAQMQNAQMDAASLESARDVTADQASRYMGDYYNPYTGEVIDASLATLADARDRQQAASDMQAARAGAFGGSRHGIRDAQVADDYLRNVAATTANLRNQMFQQALGAGTADASRMLTAGQSNQQRDIMQAQQQAALQQQAAQMNAQLQQQAAQQNALLAQEAAARNQDFLNQQALRNADLTQQGRLADIDSRYRSDAQRMGAVRDMANTQLMAEQLANARDIERLDLLANIGGQQQAQDQRVLDEPFDALQFRAGMLGMTPLPQRISQTGSVTTTGTPSPLSTGMRFASLL